MKCDPPCLRSGEGRCEVHLETCVSEFGEQAGERGAAGGEGRPSVDVFSGAAQSFIVLDVQEG